jgi:hypothetical protein
MKTGIVASSGTIPLALLLGLRSVRPFLTVCSLLLFSLLVSLNILFFIYVPTGRWRTRRPTFA